VVDLNAQKISKEEIQMAAWLWGTLLAMLALTAFLARFIRSPVLQRAKAMLRDILATAGLQIFGGVFLIFGAVVFGYVYLRAILTAELPTMAQIIVPAGVAVFGFFLILLGRSVERQGRGPFVHLGFQTLLPGVRIQSEEAEVAASLQR